MTPAVKAVVDEVIKAALERAKVEDEKFLKDAIEAADKETEKWRAVTGSLKKGKKLLEEKLEATKLQAKAMNVDPAEIAEIDALQLSMSDFQLSRQT